MDKLIFNTHDVILLTTMYQSTLFALLILVIKRDLRASDWFLMGFLLTQAAIPMHILINFGEAFRFIAIDWSPNLYRYFEVAYWLEGPLLLWYTRSLVYKNYRFRPMDMLFLLPVVLYLGYTWVTFYGLAESVKVEALLNSQITDQDRIPRHLISFSREILRVAFSVLCLIDIRHCQQQIRNRYSHIDDVDFRWLKFLVIAFMIVRIWAVLVSLSIILSVNTGLSIDFASMGLAGNYCVFVLVSALIFFSLMHSHLFEGIDNTIAEPAEPEKRDADPETVAHIEAYMASKKPFLATILNLEQLAKQLELAPRTLSNTINRHYKQNFFEFVNHYRIEEAKRQLTHPDLSEKTIIEIMADSGFNSKATFNTFFKKVEGLTPSQYRARRN